MHVVVTAVLTALASIGVKLLTTAVIEKLVVVGLKRLAQATDSKVDDEIVAVVLEAIEGPAPKVASAENP